MKFIKLSGALLASCTLLFVACSKDEETPVVPGVQPALLTKTFYYEKAADTTGIPEYTDSLYYNNVNQLLKVRSTKKDGTEVTYDLVYNAKRILTNVKVTGSSISEFIFAYDSQDKMAYMKVKDNVNATPDSVVTWGAVAGGVSTASVLHQYGEKRDSVSNYHMEYSFSSAEVIDSLYTRTVMSSKLSRTNMFYPSKTVSPLNEAFKSVDKSYSLILALRLSVFPMDSEYYNVFMHKFLNPQANVFNDGVYSGFVHGYPDLGWTKMDYKNDYILDADKKVTRYGFSQEYSDGFSELLYIKFSYNK